MQLTSRMFRVLFALALSGCAAQEPTPKSIEAPPDNPPVANVLKMENETVENYSETVIQPSTLTARSDVRPKPDAVVEVLQPQERRSRELDKHLAEVAMQAKASDQVLLQLHGYAPISGSSSMDIAMADKSLMLVRERLQALGVPSQKIFATNFGHQYPILRYPPHPWVEIFLVRKDSWR
jgi:hypothetical protein